MITLWLDGLLACGVIQNHMAVLNDMVGSAATRSGLFMRSVPMALPAHTQSFDEKKLQTSLCVCVCVCERDYVRDIILFF